MDTINVAIEYNHELWKLITEEMDEQGKIVIGEDSYIQVLPLTNAYFMPEVESAIEFAVGVASNVALGLVVNWLYDKLKTYGAKKIVVDNEEHAVTDKKSIEIAISISVERKYEKR